MQNIGQNKKAFMSNNIKMENNGFKKVPIKNRTSYYFDDIISLKHRYSC